MGPVVNMLDDLPDRFLVMNGDVLTDLSYAGLLASHQASDAPITIATHMRRVEVDFGVLELEDGAVVGFREKPVLEYAVSMGVYAVSRTALADAPRGEAYGFDHLMRDLLAAGTAPASFPFTGYWLDIGRRANAEFAEVRTTLLPGT
jgi:mannose-1-phosphate guanylyltransferase